MGGNGGIIGPANIPAASEFSSVASGVWSLTEAQENNSGGNRDGSQQRSDWHLVAVGGSIK